MGSDRYSRQVLAFGREGQAGIASSRVGIVGLGGLGSQAAQGLAYLGVRDFVLVDDDLVEESNLNRLIGAVPADAASARKVDVAERLVRAVQPGADVETVGLNLRSTEALRALTSCPVIFGCVDHDGPRLILMELAAAYGATLIDCASDINVEDGQLREFGGRVVVSPAGEFCLDCAGEIDREVAKAELESPLTQEVRRAHGYGLGRHGPSPSVVCINGVVANLAVTEFLAMAAGVRKPTGHLVYYGLRGGRVNVREAKRPDDCYTCGYLAHQGDGADIFRYANPDG